MDPFQFFMMQMLLAQNMNNNIPNWKNGYSIGNFDQNQVQFNNNNQIERMNFVFKMTNGSRINLLFDPEKTVEDLILTFFRRMNSEHLFEKGGVTFIYNASEINYHTKNKAKNFFYTSTVNPTIVVVDVNNLIGA